MVISVIMGALGAFVLRSCIDEELANEVIMKHRQVWFTIRHEISDPMHIRLGDVA